ncbi:MAG: hypothetical protein K8S14_05955 [Actinomycetia bacterium]|nr:hypothetical protein [Actinomycetes bacterium]
MREAKERLKEFWTRGKQINPVKYKNVLKRQAKKILKREIKYISSFFPYDIVRFHNPALIYLQGLLFAGNFYREISGDSREPILDRRLINLIIGLELLAVGTSFHNFKASGSSIAGKDTGGTGEKEYTLDLLFGDIFYSRAVIYLLRYQDHEIFDRILKSMKRVHESKLKLHAKMQEAIEEKIETSLIDSDAGILIDANRLLYVSFEIGNSLSDYKNKAGQADGYFDIAEKTVLFKTYSELLEYARAFSGTLSVNRIMDYLNSKKILLAES